ncbi:MAG: hypothetical protein K1X75_01670 [Leptospirales bacterium]|nr:hypothetical protein [Leptospirales bacterium]
MNKAARLILFYAAAFLQGVCLVVLPGAADIIKQADQNGISSEQYGWFTIPLIVGVIAVSFTMSFLPSSPLARMSPGKLFRLGAAVDAAFLGLLALSRLTLGQPLLSLGVFLAAQLMLGMGFSLLVSVLNTQVIALYPARSHTVLTGMHATLGIGAAAAPLLVNAAAASGSWQLAPALSALLFLVLILLPFGMSAPTAASARADAASQRLPAGAWFFLAAIVLYGIVEAIVAYWSVDMLKNERGLDAAEAKLALSLFWFAVTLGRLAASAAALYLSSRAVYLLSAPLVIGCLAAVALAPGANAWSMQLLFAALGFGASWFFPFSISLSIERYPRHEAALSALALAALMAGYGIGPPAIAAGLSAKLTTLSGAFAIAAIFGLLYGLAALRAATMRHTTAEATP